MAGHNVKWQHRCAVEMVPSLSALFHVDKPGDDDTEAAGRSEDGSFQDWLKHIHVSASTDGLVLAFANTTQTVFMIASKNTGADGLKTYELAWQGSPEESNGDGITAVLTLTVSPPNSAQPWHVIVVGFASGQLRFYLPRGELLMSQWLHRDTVSALHCQAGGLHLRTIIPGEEVVVAYSNVVVAVDGQVLLNCLTACMQNKDADDIPSLSFKKYSFQDIRHIQDIITKGNEVRSPLAVLREACFSQRDDPRVDFDMVTNYITASDAPPIACHLTAEKVIRPTLGLVVSVVTERVKSAVASRLSWASSWLGVGPTEDNMAGRTASTPVPASCSFHDSGRGGRGVALSPCGRWVACTDTMGRVFLLDSTSMLVMRVWKGYRDAQCGWVAEVEEEEAPSSSASSDDEHSDDHSDDHSSRAGRATVFLLIYAPRRGIVELWPSGVGQRIGAFNVGKQCRLLYNPFSVLGQGRRGSLYPVLYHSALLHPSGSLWTLRVPFVAASSIEEQQAWLDQQAVDNIANADESSMSPLDLQEAVLSIVDPVLVQQAVSVALRRDFSAETLLDVVKAILDKWQGPNEDALCQSCRHNARILELYKGCHPSSNSITVVEEKPLAEVLEELHYKSNLPGYDEATMVHVVESCNDLVTAVTSDALLERPEAWPVGNVIDSFRAGFSNGLAMLELQPKMSEMQLGCIGLALCHGVLSGDVSRKEFVSHCLDAGLPIATITMLVLRAFLAMPVFSGGGVLVLNLRNVLRQLNEESHNDVWPAAHSVLLQAKRVGAAWLASMVVSCIQEGRRSALEETAGSQTSVEWQSINTVCEEWTLMQLRLRDLVFLAAVTKLGLSVDAMLGSECSLLTIQVAKWMVQRRLLPHVMFDAERQSSTQVSRQTSTASRHSQSDPDSEVSDGDEDERGVLQRADSMLTSSVPLKLPGVSTLLLVFPVALAQDVLLVECCNEAAQHWSANVEDTERLQFSLTYFFGIDSRAIKKDLAVFIWLHFLRSFELKLLKVLDKVGPTLKDSVCQRYVGLSWSTSRQVLGITSEFLLVLDQLLASDVVRPEDENLPEFECDGNWDAEAVKSSWPGASVMSKLWYQRPAQAKLATLHKELVYLMHARMWLLGKFKPSSLFPIVARDVLELPLTSFSHYLEDSEYPVLGLELLMSREKALAELCSAAASDQTAVARIKFLLEILSLNGDVVRSKLVLELMKDLSAQDWRLSAAIELISKVKVKDDLGVQVFELGAEHVVTAFKTHFSRRQQGELIAQVTPVVSTWLDLKITAEKDRKATAQCRAVIKAANNVLRQSLGLLHPGQHYDIATMLMTALASGAFQ